MSTNELVGLPLLSRMDGTYVIGKPGTGKTTLLLSMLKQDMEQGRGICFLDPHGDAALDLLRHVPAGRRGDVLFLDASDDDYLFGLNLFANPGGEKSIGLVAARVVQIFKRAWGSTAWGPRLEDTLYNLSYVMAATGGTLSDVPTFFYDAGVREQRLRNVTSKTIVDYWRYDFGNLSAAGQREVRASVLNKVRLYLSNPAIERIVSHPDSIDFRAAMDESKIVIVRLPDGLIDSSVVSLLGSAIVDQIANAAMSRANTSNRPPFILCADEFHRFATPTFGKLIQEARKYGVATMAAHQSREQLPTEVRDALLSVRTFIVFEVSGKDSAELGKEFAGAPPIMVHPQDLYGYLDRYGDIDTVLMTHFREVREVIENFVSDYVYQLRINYGKKKVLVMHQLNTDRDEQKRLLSQFWHDLPDNVPTKPADAPKMPDGIWDKYKFDVFMVAWRLMLNPILVPARDQPQDEPFTALIPHTARVKLRIEGRIEEHTIRTIPLPAAMPWLPGRRQTPPLLVAEEVIFNDEPPPSSSPR